MNTPAAIKTRKPTGKPPWPIVLLAGAEKAGKSYAAAEASAADVIGATYWISIGEDDPDEYGALPGADFEIVQHDGTYRGILRAVDAAAAQPLVDGKPNLLVLDSMTRLWDLLCDEAQVVANDRAARKARKANKPEPVDDVQITMDLWNAAKQRWQHIIDVLREHTGPSLVTARLELVTVMDANGNPTKDRSWKVKAEKSLPFDVGVIVEMPARGETYLTGVRSLRFKSEPGERVKYETFTVLDLWTQMGLVEPGATAPRQHTANVPDAAITQQPGGNPHNDLLREIAGLAQQTEGGVQAVAAEWAESHGGQDIRYATDVGGLELLRDDLAERVRHQQKEADAA